MIKFRHLLPVALIWPGSVFGQKPAAPEIARWRAQSQKVTITRDDWGIPHIHGKTDADAVFGVLYAQCEENFSKVEENNLEMLGRLSELRGPGDIYNDLEMRLIYDTAAAEADFARAPVWLQSLCTAAADAVNFYLYEHPEIKPAVLHRFQPWYQLMRTNGSISATQNGGILTDDMQTLYPVAAGTIAYQQPKIGNGDLSDPPGSNGFAAGPSRTASGNAILYINPHVTFYFRSEMQVSSDEGLNSYGAVTWGTFFVFQGFNDYGGWMHTSGMADVADLYAEKTIRKGDSIYTELDGKLMPVRTREVKIRCRAGGADSVYSFLLYDSYHGPVMGVRNGLWLSLREKNRSLSALEQSWLRTKTKGFDEFRKVMEMRSNTSDNTVYADTKGHIAYWHGNFVPHRSKDFDYSLPVDGSVSASDWGDPYPIDSIVHVYDPGSGYIQNCNSSPFTVSGSGSPSPENFPVYMAPDGENFRSLNAARLLANARQLTVDRMITGVGYNARLVFFDTLLPVLINDWTLLPDSDSRKTSLRGPVQRLREWDHSMSDSSEALSVAIEYGYRLLRSALPPADRFGYGHNVETLRRVLQSSSASGRLNMLAETVKELDSLFGTWQVAWGRINRYQRLPGGHSDDAEPSFASGLVPSDFGAIPAFGSRRPSGMKNRYGYYGNSFVACVEFGKRIKAKSIITGGQSFDPASPHYADQVDGYLHGRFKTVYFYPEDLRRHTVRKYHPGE